MNLKIYVPINKVNMEEFIAEMKIIDELKTMRDNVFGRGKIIGFKINGDSKDSYGHWIRSYEAKMILLHLKKLSNYTAKAAAAYLKLFPSDHPIILYWY